MRFGFNQLGTISFFFVCIQNLPYCILRKYSPCHDKWRFKIILNDLGIRDAISLKTIWFYKKRSNNLAKSVKRTHHLIKHTTASRLIVRQCSNYKSIPRHLCLCSIVSFLTVPTAILGGINSVLTLSFNEQTFHFNNGIFWR